MQYNCIDYQNELCHTNYPFARGEIVDRNERYKSVRVVKGGFQYCVFTITIVFFMDFNPERSTTIVEYQRHQKKTKKEPFQWDIIYMQLNKV